MKKSIIGLLTILFSISMGCKPAVPANTLNITIAAANSTANQTSNMSGEFNIPIDQNQAIKIAQAWAEKTYKRNVENSPVNATPSFNGSTAVWNVTISLPFEIPDNGPPDPLGRPFHDVSTAYVTIDAKTGAVITDGVLNQRVLDQ